MMVTMTTVGYGDGFPITHMGRFITLIASVIGNLLVSLMTVSLTNTTELTAGETRVFNEMERFEVKRRTQKASSGLLMTILRCHILNKKLEGLNEDAKMAVMMKKFGLLSKMKTLLKNFKKIYKKYESYASSHEDAVIKLNNNCMERKHKVYTHFGRTNRVTRHCRRIVNDQKEINDRLDELLSFQACMAKFLVTFNRDYVEEQI